MRRQAALLLFTVGAPAGAQDRSPATASPAARAAMAEFGRCVAARSPDKARAALMMDFTSSRYRNSLRILSRNNSDCHKTRSTMRAGGLPFAAAMAETLLARDSTPLNIRLLRAARTDPPTYAPSDRVAMCVARSDPDTVARLLQSGIASPEETALAAQLQYVAARCTPKGVALELSPYALRAIVATAGYRLLETANGGGR